MRCGHVASYRTALIDFCLIPRRDSAHLFVVGNHHRSRVDSPTHSAVAPQYNTYPRTSSQRFSFRSIFFKIPFMKPTVCVTTKLSRGPSRRSGYETIELFLLLLLLLYCYRNKRRFINRWWRRTGDVYELQNTYKPCIPGASRRRRVF